MTDDYRLGQTVQLKNERIGIIRYIGDTSFASGEWIGVELEDQSGKNDGSVQGQRYFECDMGHGMFLRPTGIATVLDQLTPKPAPAATRNVGTNSRAGVISNKSSRTSSIDPLAAKRQSLNSASPTPAPRRQTTVNGTRSSSKLTARVPGSTATSSVASSRGATPPMTGRKPPSRSSVAPRSSLATKPSSTAPLSTSVINRQPRQSLAPIATTNGNVVATRPPAMAQNPPSRLSTLPNGKNETAADGSESARSSPLEDETSAKEEEAPAAISTNEARPAANVEPEVHADEDRTSRVVKTDKRPLPKSQASVTSRPLASNKIVEELESKIKVLEKRRAEDRDKLQSLERLKTERDRFEGIINKLQTKYQPQQQELAELRQQLKDSNAKLEAVEAAQGEHETDLEMAMLDREMAEELAESIQTELDALKTKAEELQMEVEILREENEELGREMSPDERTSQGWLQLERSNGRLREALLRLRDMTQSSEAELKKQIASLEAELKGLDGIKDQYDEVQEKLRQSDVVIADLRQQLDAALGSEDMLEELTEKNLGLNSQIDDLKLTIEDLENLKELSDELEITHIETEKQLQDELDFKDTLLKENVQQLTQQDEKLADYQYAIMKFRELVSSLQTDVQDMKASKQISEAEAQELTNRSRAMEDLNLKLQTSAARTQTNALELEMRKLDAQEAAEHLLIVQMFLPETFQADKDSVSTYLRFKRIAYKAQILYSVVRERTNKVSTQTRDTVFVSCDIMDKLSWISATCWFFVDRIKIGSTEQFEKFGSALYDLEPLERSLNGYIEAFKRDEIRENAMADELQRSILVLQELQEVYADDLPATYANRIVLHARTIQARLDHTAVALNLTKLIVEQAAHSTAKYDDADAESRQVLNELNTIISLARNTKVSAGKCLQSIDELKVSSLTLPENTHDSFEDCESSSAALVTCAVELGSHIISSLETSEGTNGISVPRAQTAIQSFQSSAFTGHMDSVSISSFRSRLRSISDQIGQISSIASDKSATVEFDAFNPPWTRRSQALKQQTATSASMETDLQRMHDAMQERIDQLRSRDQKLDEQSVKIEVLESRMRDANEKTVRIAELEKTLDTAKQRETELTIAVESKFGETKLLQAELERVKELVANRRDSTDVDDRSLGRGAGEKSVATALEIDVLRTQIRGLEDAVRYLRSNDSNRAFANANYQSDMDLLRNPLSSRKQDGIQDSLQDLRREAYYVFDDMLSMIQNATIVDLSKRPKNKLAWRPLKDQSGWQVARQEEDWQRWKTRRRDVVRKARATLGLGLTAVAENGERQVVLDKAGFGDFSSFERRDGSVYSGGSDKDQWGDASSGRGRGE